MNKQQNCPNCGGILWQGHDYNICKNNCGYIESRDKSESENIKATSRVRLLELVLRSVYNRIEDIADCPRDDVDMLSDMTEALRVLVDNALDEDKEEAVLEMLKMDGTISE